MSDNGQQVPLIEQLRRVPEGAVWVETVAEHDMRGVGYAYTQNHPVGALCREAAARIDELERENDALSMEASENLQRREKAESDFKELSISSNARVAEGLLARSAVALAAERERREAAETDAGRYRWLREWRARWEIRYWGGMFWDSFNADKLDAAIDKEAAKSPGTEPMQSKLVED